MTTASGLAGTRIHTLLASASKRQPAPSGGQTSAAGTAAPLRGTAEGIDEWGCLLVRDGAGIRHTVAAGDVSLRGD